MPLLWALVGPYFIAFPYVVQPTQPYIRNPSGGKVYFPFVLHGDVARSGKVPGERSQAYPSLGNAQAQ